MVCCSFFTKFPLEKKSVFSHTCSGGSPVMNIFLPPITDLFYNFSRRIFSRKTHIDRRLNLSDPPNKLSLFSKNWDNLFGGSLKFNRRSTCVFREKMRLEKLQNKSVIGGRKLFQLLAGGTTADQPPPDSLLKLTVKLGICTYSMCRDSEKKRIRLLVFLCHFNIISFNGVTGSTCHI